MHSHCSPFPCGMFSLFHGLSAKSQLHFPGCDMQTKNVLRQMAERFTPVRKCSVHRQVRGIGIGDNKLCAVVAIELAPPPRKARCVRKQVRRAANPVPSKFPAGLSRHGDSIGCRYRDVALREGSYVAVAINRLRSGRGLPEAKSASGLVRPHNEFRSQIVTRWSAAITTKGWPASCRTWKYASPLIQTSPRCRP